MMPLFMVKEESRISSKVGGKEETRKFLRISPVTVVR